MNIIHIISFFVGALLGYFFGSIPFALIVGKIFFHKDVRLEGSKNLGATNVARTIGKKASIIVALLDALKCIIAIYLTLGVLTLLSFTNDSFKTYIEYAMLLAALFTTIGHFFPIFAKFKGGKGVATSLGFFLCTNPVVAAIGVSVFFIIVFTIKYVSLGSIIGYFTVVVFTWLAILNNFNLFFNSDSTIYLFYSIAITTNFLLVVLKHIPNIKRLVKGTERKAFSKKKEENSTQIEDTTKQ